MFRRCRLQCLATSVLALQALTGCSTQPVYPQSAYPSYTQSASAQPAYSTQLLNLRAGPGEDFPVVTVLSPSTNLMVQGCLDDYYWCDVSLPNGSRGWVMADYIAYPYQGRSVEVRSIGPSVGIPVVTFALGAYWGSYYRDRSWYNDRSRWDHYDYHHGRRPPYGGGGNGGGGWRQPPTPRPDPQPPRPRPPAEVRPLPERLGPGNRPLTPQTEYPRPDRPPTEIRPIPERLGPGNRPVAPPAEYSRPDRPSRERPPAEVRPAPERVSPGNHIPAHQTEQTRPERPRPPAEARPSPEPSPPKARPQRPEPRQASPDSQDDNRNISSRPGLRYPSSQQ